MTRILLYTGFLLTLGLFGLGAEVQPELAMLDPQLVLQPGADLLALDILPVLPGGILLSALLFALLLVVPIPTRPAQPVFSASKAFLRRGPPGA